MDKDCYINVNDVLIEAEFIGVYQYSKVIEPSIMRGGHGGGVIAYPVAIVKYDGRLREVKISKVTFKD